MNLCQIILPFGFLLILHLVNSKNMETVDSLRAVSNSIQKFSTKLYQTNAQNEKDNFVCSSLSLHIVLSMIAQGAQGNTKKQLQNGLYLPEDDKTTQKGSYSLIDAFKDTKKITLQLAQKIYTEKNLEVKSEFKGIAKKYFQSSVESLDFTDTQEASSIINDWTANQTNNYVKKIINADDLEDAAVVLVNTIHLKANWMLPFASINTQTELFHIDERTTKKVEMMNQKSWLNYGDLPELGARYVELPYEHENQEDRTSFFIILPNEVNGLLKAQTYLETVNFEKLHKRQKRTKVDLTVPKFKVESSPKLQPVLEEMGMTDMFGEVANFTGITNSPLKVSKIVQKAVIEISERGTTASAATVLVAVFRSTPIRENITPLKIDHPFIFVIYHGVTKSILFHGHVKVPRN